MTDAIATKHRVFAELLGRASETFAKDAKSYPLSKPSQRQYERRGDANPWMSREYGTYWGKP